MSEKKKPQGELLDHNYDGIEELNNPLPMWWQQLFWATIIFAVGYFVYYQYMGGPTLQDELASDLKVAQEQQKASSAGADEGSLATLVGDAKAIEAGKKVFAQYCIACHAADGGGGIGPNLTDTSWIHGNGEIADVYKVINEGVVAKGMPTWGTVLSSAGLKNVAAFVVSLKGTTPANPKAAQGTVK